MDGKITYHAPLTAEQRQHLDRHGWVIDNNHNMLNREQVAALDAQRAENEAARRRYLAGLDAKRAEARRQEEERIDTLLAPRKQIERHKWLAAHPDRTPNDFEREWRDHLRPVAVAEMEEGRQQTAAVGMATSGRYSF